MLRATRQNVVVQQVRKYTIKKEEKVLSKDKLGAMSESISSSIGFLTPVAYSVHNGTIQVSKLKDHDTISRIQHKKYERNVSAPIHRGGPSLDKTDASAGQALFGIPDRSFSKKVKEWTLQLQHFTGTPTGEFEIGMKTGIVRPRTQYQGGNRGDMVSFDLHTATAQAIVEKTQKAGIEHSELIFVPVNHPAIIKFELIKNAVEEVERRSELSEKEFQTVVQKHGRSEFESIVTLKAIIKDQEDGVFCIDADSLMRELPTLHAFFSKSVPQEGSFCLRKTSKRDEWNEPVFKLVETEYTPPIDDVFEIIEIDND